MKKHPVPRRYMRRLKLCLDNRRCQFWGYLMDYHPRLYKWADTHLPFNTLPF